MSKQKLIEEKRALVSQFNMLQEKLDGYGFDVLANDNWTFRDEANKKKAIELRIQQINRLLDDINE